MATVDLNVDLGEGRGDDVIGDEVALLDVVTSANVACGFHGGDPVTARRVCELAVARGVAIGAHVSYDDLEGFGRRDVSASHGELVNDVLYQIGGLASVARAAGGRVTYVKPHGALYNRIVDDDEHASAVVEAVRTFDASLAVVGLPGARVVTLARDAGLPTVTEAFCDRAYTPAGTLVPRSEPGAVLHDPEVLGQRARGLVHDRQVVAVDGSIVEIDARTICVHGDTPGAAAIARSVRAALEEAGITLAPFAPPA